jgi:hypothetical protein
MKDEGQPDPTGWGAADLNFVFVLPVVCLIADLLLGGFVSLLSPVGFVAALLLGMSAYVTGSRPIKRDVLHGAVTGVLATGSLMALAIFLVLLPLSVALIAWFGLGLLGFVPLGTAYYVVKRARGLSSSRDLSPQWIVGAIAGGLLVVFIPFGLHWLDVGYIARAAKQLESPDASVRLVGLTRLERYPLCNARCARRVCHRYFPAVTSGTDTVEVNATPEERAVLTKMIGPDLFQKCQAILD